MLPFRRMRTLQKFASVHASVHNHFPTERHLLNHDHYKQSRAAALAEWRRGVVRETWVAAGQGGPLA
jgi:putative transposase